MALPLGLIAGGILKIVGKLGKGKMTIAGIATTAAGMIGAGLENQNPFESARVLIDLIEKGWPHALIVVGGIATIAGYFRKAGAHVARTEL